MANTPDTYLELEQEPPALAAEEPDLLARIAGRRWMAAGLIIVTCLVLFLPGFFTLPPIDRDESRFAQATRQMVQTGDYVDIRFQNGPRHKKPVGIYWLQSAFVQMAGAAADTPIWVYRLPSLAGAIAAALLTWLIGGLLFGPVAGLVSGLMMGAVILLGVEARLAKTDAALLATILCAQYFLARAWIGHTIGRSGKLVFYAALGVGMLIKGPVILMVTGLTMVVLAILRRGISWLRPLADLFGLALFAVIVLPWYIAIGIKTGGDFYAASLGVDMWGKVTSGKENHGAPPGVFALVMIGTFWPASMLVPSAVSWMRGKFADPAVRFCLAWIIPTWLIFELVPTKLPHYVLAVYPALALLAAVTFLELANGRGQGLFSRIWSAILFVIPLLMAIAVGVLSYELADAVDIVGILLCLASAAVGFWTWRQLAAPFDRVRVLAAVILGAALFYAGVLGSTAPRLNELWISGRLAKAITQYSRCVKPVVITIGFYEPSLVFLAPSDIQSAPGGNITTHMEGQKCGLLFLEERQRQAVIDGLAGTAFKLEKIGAETGRNLNGGRQLDIGVYAIAR